MRTDFDTNVWSGLGKRAQAGPEAYGQTHVVAPIRRADDLCSADAAPRYIRDQADARRGETGPCSLTLHLRHHRLDESGNGRRARRRAGSILHPCCPTWRADHRPRRTDRRRRPVSDRSLRQSRPADRFYRWHRGPEPPGQKRRPCVPLWRQGLHEASPRRDKLQRIGKLEDAGNRRSDVLADRVSHHHRSAQVPTTATPRSARTRRRTALAG